MGHKVALALPDHEGMIVGLLGVLKAGATATLFNQQYKADERCAVLDELEPDMVLSEIPGEPGEFSSVSVKRDDVAIIFFTSGSTGKPRGAVFSHSAIEWSINSYSNDIMNLSGEDTVLATLPLAHAFGLLSTILAPLSANAKIVLLDQFAPQDVLNAISRDGVTVFPAVATMLRAVVDKPELGDADLSSLRYALSGAAACPWSLCQEWRLATGTPIVRGYGMTEVLRPISFGAADRAEVPDGTGRALPGVSIRVVDAEGSELKPGKTGQLWVRSPACMTGYLNQPEATDEVLKNGWMRTSDLAIISQDGIVSLVGRAEDIVNRGGEKVAPLEVEAVLSQHPGVKEALVFPVDHPTLGEDLVAAIVPAHQRAVNSAGIASFAMQRLASFKVPSRYLFVDQLPTNSMGKFQRSAISAEFQKELSADRCQPQSAENDRPPTDLEKLLIRLWVGVLDVERVGLNDDFFGLGGDSLRATELFLEIEKELGRVLSISLLFEAGTVSELAKRIESGLQQSCIVPIQPDGKRPPFFCVHDLSGHVMHFRSLANRCHADQPFFGIQSPGIDSSNVPFVGMDDMAEFYVDRMRTIQPHGPYYIGGYSFGGRVAFRMAQLLADEQEDVALLVMIDAWSRVGRQRVKLSRWLKSTRNRIAAMNRRELFGFVAFWLKRVIQEFAIFPLRNGFFAAVLALCQGLGRPLPRFLREPVLANRHIAARYRAQPYQGDAVLLAAKRTDWAHPNKHEGWRQLVKGKLDIRGIPGEHMEIFQEPYVGTLAKELEYCLERARADAVAPSANRLVSD